MNQNKAVSSVKELMREAGLQAYSVRFDVDDTGADIYDLNAFVNALIYELSDFAFGGQYWPNATPNNPAEAIHEAAKSIYQIKEFREAADIYAKGGGIDDSVHNRLIRRGEFGELILFFLLKNYNNTIPLLSKIYFKDSDGFAVHGFDAVHYQASTKSLWLGESKCYENSKKGVEALIQDTKDHILGEYLSREFMLVSKKFQSADINDTERKEIINLLNSERSLADKLDTINIPLLCTFTSPTLSVFTKESEAFLDTFKKEMLEIKQHFDKNNNHPLKDRLNIILLLMPVKSKGELVGELHKRLTYAQGILQ